MSHNKNIILTDSSQNIFDSSQCFFTYNKNIANRQITPLHYWGVKNNIKKSKKKNQDQNNINTNNFIFSMRLDDILNNMKTKREANYRNISYTNIVNYLDTRSLLLTNKTEEYNWSGWLQKINKKYNDITAGNIISGSSSSSSSSQNLLGYNSYSYRQQRPYRLLHPTPPPARPLEPPPPPPKKEKVNINVEIKSLKDILQLCKDYPIKHNIEYNIDMKAIHNIKTPLMELDNMIGLSPLKLAIMDQILYFIQNLHKTDNIKNNDFMHTVIYGPPGTGKTEVAKIMGKIFSKMGILPRNVFKKATRADLIAGYLGQTALKTKDLVKECLGGVLFIDEAYALGNDEKRDSFAKECIDTLCEALSDHKDNLMVIIAGYEDQLKDCFFAYNQGLDSRFTWRFKTTDYNPDELKAIFEKKVKDAKWDFKNDIPTTWFVGKKEYFKFFGRDMETLFAKTKIAHSRRIFGKDKKNRKKLTLQDVERGFEMYCENSDIKQRKNMDESVAHLYL